MVPFWSWISWIALLAASLTSPSNDRLPGVQEVELTGEPLRLQLSKNAQYSLTWTIPSLAELERSGAVTLRAADDRGPLFTKTLDSGDGDFYTLFRVRSDHLSITVETSGSTLPRMKLRLVHWEPPLEPEAAFESEPNDSWRAANPIQLGMTVWGGGDDQPYFPLPGQTRSDLIRFGEDWYTFEFQPSKPALVFFWLDLLDRDNIPVDVLVFREQEGELVAYEEGVDPVTPPHEVQAMHGNKFTTRVLREPGRYYLRVLSHHPAYQLKTALYPVPPYSDPGQAVRTAVDYLLGAGDSWHANTPRKGGVHDRVSSYHHETSLCVACHPTHFTLRGQLYALKNGYPVRQRPQLQFLAERFYNNPIPLYELTVPSHEVSWTRVISAPANVLSRMAALNQILEKELTGERRDRFLRGIGEYLKLYYGERTELPPDETNGNRPLVSTFEVAWYSWEVLDELYRRNGEAEYASFRDRVQRLVEEAEVKNVIDLCYQTLAFCAMDRERYADRIRRNAEQILSLQRPSGQWAATFDPEDPEAEFQTGHCLWTLAEAGYSPQHPAVARGVGYLLQRQLEFGGWFDPLQSYENFRTPFRETQMAVLALSSLFPANRPGGASSPRGWGAAFPPVPDRLDFSRPDRLLSQLDNIWEPVDGELLGDIVRALAYPEVQVRAAAAACLGRISDGGQAPQLARRLADSSKIVQRAAAWALRTLYSRTGKGTEVIAAALQENRDRVRWGAVRIFSQHFSELAKNSELSARLLDLASDPIPVIRLQAVKGLWQLWYWSADATLRSRIEDLLLQRLAVEADPRVVRNLQEGLYILADDNIRYLYNNWIPLLAREEDRDRIVLARLRAEKRLSAKLARALESEDPRLRRRVLSALADFHLRSPDSYEKEGEPESERKATFYTRIGNDIETVKFFGESAETLAQRLLPLLKASDVEIRRLAARVAFVVREDRIQPDYGGTRQYGLADVVRLAGPYEEGRRRMAETLLELLLEEDSELRSVALDVHKSFTPEVDTGNLGHFLKTLGSLLDSSYPEARSAAWDLIREFGAKVASRPEFEAQVHQAFLAEEEVPGAYPALQFFPSLLQRRDVQMKIYRALGAAEMPVFQAAVELCLNAPELERVAVLQRRLSGAFVSEDAKRRRAILELASREPDYLKDLRLLSLLSESLNDPDPSLSGTALSLVRRREELRQIPSVAEALARREERAGKLQLPDFEFFKSRVEPLLEAPGADGKACVNCHDTHAILRLRPPGPEGASEEHLREHYRSALRVIDLEEPENSLLLRKPTSSAEAEGTLSATPNSHGGGIRWGKYSPSYRTILDWIYTARR